MRRSFPLRPVLGRALALASVLTPLPRAAIPHAPGPGALGACLPVHGEVSARVTGLALGLHGLEVRGEGTSSGDLAGPVRLSIRKRANHADTLRFTAMLTIERSAGRVVMKGDGTAVRSAGQSSVRRVDGRLDVSAGPGDFASVAGAVHATGKADTGARSVELEYTGSVCAG